MKKRELEKRIEDLEYLIYSLKNNQPQTLYSELYKYVVTVNDYETVFYYHKNIEWKLTRGGLGELCCKCGKSTNPVVLKNMKGEKVKVDPFYSYNHLKYLNTTIENDMLILPLYYMNEKFILTCNINQLDEEEILELNKY